MNKLEQLNKRLDLLESKRQKILDEINKIENKKQKICNHLRVEKSGGDVWHDWPDYGYDPYYLTCLDCDLTVSSKKYDELYRQMDRNVVIDNSYHSKG